MCNERGGQSSNNLVDIRDVAEITIGMQKNLELKESGESDFQ